MTAQAVDPQSFDHLAASYERLGRLTGNPFGDLLGSFLPVVGRRAVDLGCGAGRNAMILADRFREVDAIDLSESMIQVARALNSRPNVVYHQTDLHDCGGVGEYDFVLSVATLHHVPDLGAALRHIRALVAPGGRVLLIDLVSPRPVNPRWRMRLGLVRNMVKDLGRHGPAVAWEIYRLSGGAWLDHLVSDRYLSREQFEQAYGEVFPEGRFMRVLRAHAVVWDAADTID